MTKYSKGTGMGTKANFDKRGTQKATIRAKCGEIMAKTKTQKGITQCRGD